MNSDVRREIRVCEHGKDVILDVPLPTPADERLAEALRKAARIEVEWLSGGRVSVSAFQWVGLARFDNFDIVVEPRLVGSEVRVLQMLEYTAGMKLASFIDNSRPLPPSGLDLVDLVCHLLAREAQRLLQAGLLHDYRSESETLPLLRGRIRVRDQVLKRFGQVDQLECDFDEYDSNVLENQVVRLGLAVAQRVCRSSEVRDFVRRISVPWEQACPLRADLSGRDLDAVVYGRRNNRYRQAHYLCRMLLEGTALGDLFVAGTGSISSFFINMSALFERFLTRILEDQAQAAGFTVRSQRRFQAIVTNDMTSATYMVIQPDIVITDGLTNHVMTIDAKYKGYDEKRLSAGDLYQSFTYAYSLSQPAGRRRGLVVFPSHAPRMERISVAARDSVPSVGLTLMGIDLEMVLKALAEGSIDPVPQLLEQILWSLDRHGTSMSSR